MIQSETLNFAFGLFVFEATMLGIMLLIEWRVRVITKDGVVSFADRGPWWSVCFHRVFIATHLPALFIQIATDKITSPMRKPPAAQLTFPIWTFVGVNFIAVFAYWIYR